EDRAREAEVLANLGNVAYFQGDYERARSLFQQALDFHSSEGNQVWVLVALHGLGRHAFRSGDIAAARQLFERCLAESLVCGSRGMEAATHVSLGLLQDEEGEGQAAREHSERALCIFREIGDVSQEMICLNNLGSACRQMGDRVLSARY